MVRKKLAILGGEPALPYSLKPANSIGQEELAAATAVIKSGKLSAFVADESEAHFGGSKVREFEAAASKKFGVKHAITVNSWTSGLIAAVGALNVEPGDEIIVTPWTMCATATAILHWNAIPVFADIDSRTFCIDPDDVRRKITSKTRAIITVDIFGQSSDIRQLMSIAREFDLRVISDSAQAPGAYYYGEVAGTQAHIGGFSLNYHKHIHTGEGGILVTNDDTLAERMRCLRNHAEVTATSKGVGMNNMIGFNFRLGEIEAAMGIEQLKKLDTIVLNRQRIATQLSDYLSGLPGLTLPIIRDGCSHVFYIYGMLLDTQKLGVSRDLIVSALEAEGVEGLTRGYANLHLLPMYQNKTAYGSKGFPWSAEFVDTEYDYSKGICPVAELFHDELFMGYEMCLHDQTDHDLELLAQCFEKVWAQLDELKPMAGD
jgi:perosamine synthetase